MKDSDMRGFVERLTGMVNKSDLLNFVSRTNPDRHAFIKFLLEKTGDPKNAKITLY